MKKILSLILSLGIFISALGSITIAHAEDGDTIKGNAVSIYDSVTKQTYSYIDFNGEPLMHTYMGMQA